MGESPTTNKGRTVPDTARLGEIEALRADLENRHADVQRQLQPLLSQAVVLSAELEALTIEEQGGWYLTAVWQFGSLVWEHHVTLEEALWEVDRDGQVFQKLVTPNGETYDERAARALMSKGAA